MMCDYIVASAQVHEPCRATEYDYVVVTSRCTDMLHVPPDLTLAAVRCTLPHDTAPGPGLCRKEEYSLNHYKNLQRFRPPLGWQTWRSETKELCSKVHGPGCHACLTCHFCRCICIQLIAL